MNNIKIAMLTSLIVFSNAVPLNAENPDNAKFREELLVLQTKTNMCLNEKSYAHVKVKQYIDYDVKEYYEKAQDPGLEDMVLMLFGFEPPKEEKPKQQWYEEVDKLNKSVQETYKKNFGICLDIVQVYELQHEPANSVEEVMCDLQFIKQDGTDIVMGLTGARSYSIWGYVVGQADPEDTHITIMADRKQGNLTFMHEMAHMFNAPHVEDPTSIMYYATNDYNKWDANTIKTVIANKNRKWHSTEQNMGLHEFAGKADAETIKYLKRGYRGIVKKTYLNAVDDLEKVIAKYPNEGHPYYMLGEAYGANQQYKKAIPVYEKAVEKGKQYPLLLNNLAYYYLEENQKQDKALELAQKAVAKKPKEEGYIDTLAWAYYHNGKYAEAETELLKIKENTNNEEYQYHLGMVFDKLGKQDKAKIAFKKVIKLEGRLSPKAQGMLDGYGKK